MLHNHTYSTILAKPKAAVLQDTGARDSLLPQKNLDVPPTYPVSPWSLLLILALNFSLQFHRRCELSMVCDGGELKDHILLPTSICPVTRVSGTTPTRALAFPGSEGPETGNIYNFTPPIPRAFALVSD